MKRILAIILVLFLLAGCGVKPQETTEPTPETPFEYTFTDDLGREVTVTEYERTAALLGSYADVWLTAGGTVVASADDAWDEFELPLADDVVNLGSMKKLNLEALLAAEPQFVLASTTVQQHVDWEQTLEDAGICVAYFNVTNFQDYLRMLKTCTDITGREDCYKEFGTDIAPIVEAAIAHSLERTRANGETSVLFLRPTSTSVKARNSSGTVMGEALKDLNCRNIADSDSSLLDNLGMESIIQQNPEKIFIVEMSNDINAAKAVVDQLFNSDPAWQSLDAVKNNQVYWMDKKLYNLKPNKRWGEAYEKLEELLSE